MRDFAPKRGVIWIRCTDKRLLETGPVSGMSGSPIFLWDDGEEQEIGKGGKLIGAFAIGYSWTKDSYAGVQPIEMMRQKGSHIDVNAKVKATGDGTGDAKPRAAGEAKTRATDAVVGATLIDLLRSAKADSLSENITWRTETFARLSGVKIEDSRDSDDNDALPDSWPAEWEGKPMRMMLPMAVRSESMARALSPLFEPMGIRPMQSPAGMTAGLPPPDTDPKSIKLEPGSVLAIPLAFGDVDLSATGTVTDVLPDGRVLGFGHPMFGQLVNMEPGKSSVNGV
jgi:hypothetical protein